MAELNWKYAQNMFLAQTDGRRPLMLVIGADHTAKLAAKLGSPGDPDIQICIDRVQPLFDDFQLKMVTFDVVSGTRKGQTEVIKDLLDELSSQRIKQWDITIQNTFLSGTPQYTQILPSGRKPFQSGKQDERILAVQTLGVALVAFPEFAALKTTVETFHASLESARNTQQGTEGQIASASTAAEAARIVLANAMYANVGRLIEKHFDDPDRLGEYFEVSLLQSSGGSSGPSPPPDPPGPGNPPVAPEAPQLSEGTPGEVTVDWVSVTDATSYRVEKLEVGVDPDFVAFSTTTTFAEVITGLSSGTTLQVRIVAINASGESPPSAVSEITLMP